MGRNGAGLSGFWLYYKRLEKGRFQWPPATGASPSLAVSRRQLSWLLDGLSKPLYASVVFVPR
ncbi:IS66 family insertion sequence element accessory protein TnpB [Sporolactobacillus vineae]|uniref:IS66 family insertion sequence element accessory protein TnpB n=1 Tax=Sporolactobacillus vineae TaxID=444463 RepID=UPI0009D918A9